MNILAIETSCDETAVSFIEANGSFGDISFNVLGDSLHSQVELHKEYGGVFPSLAKREHAKNLVPLLTQTLSKAGVLDQSEGATLTQEQIGALKELLNREPELSVVFISFFSHTQKPNIDALTVTVGPGLEPALWVGINFAKALSLIWDIPLIPASHMEGHVLSSLIIDSKITDIHFPALALLISGGHTELVLMREWGKYEIVGETKDDAVGEAFDKVARLLELGYPGGPALSQLAHTARSEVLEQPYSLPRPMLDTDDFDFSFSGLKTAVLYLINDLTKESGDLSEIQKKQIAREFEDAVVEVLTKKTLGAISQYGAPTLIVGGGVSANIPTRTALKTELEKDFPDTKIYLPPQALTGDNAIMIGASAYLSHLLKRPIPKQERIIADGNLSL